MMAISAGIGALGAIQQGFAAQQSAKYQSRVAENNAKVAQWQARDATARGAQEEARHRLAVAGTIGTQRSALAAQGTTLDAGSPLDILGDTAAFGELDALTIRGNAEREAYGYRVQGSNFQAESGLLASQGSNAMMQGVVGAGASLLSGATRISDRAAGRFGGGTSYYPRTGTTVDWYR